MLGGGLVREKQMSYQLYISNSQVRYPTCHTCMTFLILASIVAFRGHLEDRRGYVEAELGK